MSILMLKRFSVGVPPVSISTAYTPTGGYGIRPYGLPIPLHSACRQLRRGGGTPPYVLPKKGNVGRPALWPPCPLAPSYAIRAAAPHSPGTPRGTAPWRKASLVKGRCRACEAEGFLPVCGCDSVQGIARRNPSGRLRRPPAPLLALRATSPGTGESVFDKGGFFAPTLNFTSNFTLAKSGKVCYNLIAYRFSGKYSRNPNQKRRVPPHVRTPVGNPCGFLW